MNTVAAVFVLDIDDYAFRFFTTRAVRNILTSLPPLGILSEDDYKDDVDVGAAKMGADDLVWQYLGGWILGPALLALATGLYQGWCGDDDLVLAVCFALPAACVLSMCFWCRTRSPLEASEFVGSIIKKIVGGFVEDSEPDQIQASATSGDA